MLAVCLALVAVAAGAQSVPPLINYQGRLANADGTPLPTSDYSLTIRLWNAPTGGVSVWGPQCFDGEVGPGHCVRMPIVQGYFSVTLGPIDTNGASLASVFSASNCFVEVSISNRPAILPRQQILSSPYAFSAANGSPPGTVVAFAGPESNVPAGWLLCDGRSIERVQYPQLWQAIGGSWGTGNGTTTFLLPDLRGVFLRGVNAGRTDALRDDVSERFALTGGNSGSVGSYQMDALKRHDHSYRRAIGHTPGAPGIALFADNAVDINGDRRGEINSEGNPNETRPKNAAVNYVIKY